MNPTVLLLVAAALHLVAFLLVLADSAISTTSEIRVEPLRSEAPSRVARAIELLATRDELLTAVRLLVLAAQTAQAVLVYAAVDRSTGVGAAIGAVAAAVLVAYLVEICGRTVGLIHADRLAVSLIRPLSVLVVPPIRLLARALVRIGNILVPGAGLSAGPFAHPEELIAFADAAVEDEVLEQDERDLIESVIEFGDTIVREVMVPRTDMTSISQDATVAEALERSSEVGFSRLPVEGENIDDLVGLVYVKDLIRAELDGREDEIVGRLVRSARFVPETKRVAHLLREMQEHSFHMAIAVDEYGGVAGLVTLEDCIEELVGEIVDEYDVEEPLVERQRDGSLRVDGRIQVSDLNGLAGLDLPEGDFDTVAGLVFDRFGRVPSEGESMGIDGFVLRVERVQARRITRVHIARAPVEIAVES